MLDLAAHGLGAEIALRGEPDLNIRTRFILLQES